MYVLVMTIDHHYWKRNHECHHARQVEKEALESHSWKQGKAFTSSLVTFEADGSARDGGGVTSVDFESPEDMVLVAL